MFPFYTPDVFRGYRTLNIGLKWVKHCLQQVMFENCKICGRDKLHNFVLLGQCLILKKVQTFETQVAVKKLKSTPNTLYFA